MNAKSPEWQNEEVELKNQKGLSEGKTPPKFYNISTKAMLIYEPMKTLVCT